jgi:hypothetical protein
MTNDPVDMNPGAPTGSDAYDQSAIDAANFGLDGKGDLPDSASIEAQAVHPLTIIQFNVSAALAFLKACETSIPRVGYRLGAKIPPNAVPGRDFTAVDCSGFVREAVRRSTDLGNSFPDGSVVQHDWVTKQGFSPASAVSGELKDEAVRIAFLAPTATRKIGHVVLIYNGATIESHGGVGPDSRPWNAQTWQAETSVYVLSAPAE